ncbi:MAG: type I methionyl aminopeptidase [Trueperaceae bacterium]
MSITSEQELQGMKRAGLVAAEARETLKRAVATGVSPADLNELCGEVFRKHGAVAAPRLEYGAPSHVFISVNEDVVHGLPTKRKFQAGDVVKIDVTPSVDGYIADTATTVIVPSPSNVAKRLVKCAEDALQHALGMIRAGRPLNLIGRTVERSVNRGGFRVIRQLAGHSTGRKIHEEPEVLNFLEPKDRRLLHEGLVLAVEPMIAAKNPYVVQRSDGWTIGTKDKSLHCARGAYDSGNEG